MSNFIEYAVIHKMHHYVYIRLSHIIYMYTQHYDNSTVKAEYTQHYETALPE